MDNKYAGKTGFVIMPFGKKPDLDGKLIDFDDVYQNFIKEAVEELGMECTRCDEIIDTGSIHFKMFHGIFDADVAIVDITSLNANVFYELGIRHALNKYVTLIIRKAGTPTPFNINGLTIVDYNLDNADNLSSSKEKIRNFIGNGLDKQSVDSLVHQALDNLKVERKPETITKKETQLYGIVKVPGKEVGIITGDIQNVKEADVWVNSENTNMQMARHYDRSISGTIRFLGAKKDEGGRVKDDVIANELEKIMKKTVGGDAAQGHVIPTGSGELKESNHVKKIFHAASAVGQVGRGYTIITDIEECVRNSLELVDSKKLARDKLQSILFPLMGTGASKMTAEAVAGKLINAAISYIEENPKTKIQKVFFLAYNAQDLEICTHVFDHDQRVVREKV